MKSYAIFMSIIVSITASLANEATSVTHNSKSYESVYLFLLCGDFWVTMLISEPRGFCAIVDLGVSNSTLHHRLLEILISE